PFGGGRRELARTVAPRDERAGRTGGGRGDARTGATSGEDRPSLSRRAFGRRATACRDRACTRREAEGARLRRGHLGARRLDSGGRARSARRAPARAPA